MLDRMLGAGEAPPPDRLAALARTLTDFYRAAAPLPPSRAAAHWGMLRRTAREARAGLGRWAAELGPGADAVAAAAMAGLDAHRDEVEARVRSGRVVDGHGDLRPEHVCLTDPVVVFDRVEFSAAIRAVDPFAEIDHLSVECERLGAPAIGPALRAALVAAGFMPPSDGLAAALRRTRCALRARQSMDHLLDPVPRTPSAWAPRARAYLALAGRGPRNPPGR
jgi:aminoglycoside phosphotransferase family enzyme